MMEMDDRQNNQASDGREGPSPALIGAIVVGIVGLIFVLQNTNKVKTEFLFFSFRTQVWLTIVIAIVIGALLDRLVQMWWKRRRDE